MRLMLVVTCLAGMNTRLGKLRSIFVITAINVGLPTLIAVSLTLHSFQPNMLTTNINRMTKPTIIALSHPGMLDMKNWRFNADIINFEEKKFIANT